MKRFLFVDHILILLAAITFFFNQYNRNILHSIKLVVNSFQASKFAPSVGNIHKQVALDNLKNQRTIGYLDNKSVKIPQYCKLQYLFSPSILTPFNNQTFVVAVGVEDVSELINKKQFTFYKKLSEDIIILKNKK